VINGKDRFDADTFLVTPFAAVVCPRPADRWRGHGNQHTDTSDTAAKSEK
jgi:hypothetical protein